MKRGTYTLKNRLIAMLICIVMIVGMIPVIASAAESSDSRIVDPSTINSWTDYFGPSKLDTEYSGGIWTDKSVFKDNSQFANAGITMKDAGSNFLVALSALASTKEITGYASLPTDTMLVLDISGSMQGNDARAMINATNAAIDELMSLSKYNRVGVVLYSGNHSFGDSSASSGTVILPIGSYTTTSTTTFQVDGADKTVGEFLTISGSGDSQTVSVASGVKRNGTAVTGSKAVRGGTYIQNGLYLAWKQFESASAGGTVIAPDSIQGGTQRVPIIVLMSDGEPTSATDAFNNVATSNRGNGSECTDRIAFLTQLTAAWVKGKVTAAYNNTAPLFYTLGLGTSNSNYATSILNPSSMASSSTLRTYWNTYLNGTADSTGKVTITGRNNNAWKLEKDSAVTSYQYVPRDNYYLASNAADLIEAFDAIVQQIVIQTEYYPTLTTSGLRQFDGYVSFEDDLGEFIEVKDVKGIVIGNTLFSGEEFSKGLNTGVLGTPENTLPLGDEFVWTVMERLSITTSQAQQLIDDAYNAGQLSHSNTGYSNYLGWYADANGNFLAHWNESHTEADYPKAGSVYSADAAYINRSYLYLGKTGIGNIGKTDMMHIVVQVSTEISTNHQTVLFKIPAALIPMVTYRVTLDQDTLTAGQTGSLAVESANPIQLVFEVGLRSDINPVNVSQIVGSSDHHHYDSATGEFAFFTNRWGSTDHSDPSQFDYSDPFSHLVAVANFHPSLENERYYYTEDATVYADANGTVYTGGTPTDKDPTSNGSGYYHTRYIIEAINGSDAVVRVAYDEIHDDSLAKAVAKDGRYVIPKGTVLKMTDRFNTPKSSNDTGTLVYSDHFYQVGTETGNYQAYNFLGNNGTFRMKPAAGISLRKELSEAIPGVNGYTFTVTNVPEGYSITDANGAPLNNVTASHTGTTLTLTIPVDTTVYITGLTQGSQCVVTEQLGDFHVSGLTVGGIAVTADSTVTVTVPSSGANPANLILPVVFTNSPQKYGSLIVSKDVVHPYDNAPAELTEKPFVIRVDLGDANKNQVFPVTGIAGQTSVTADANGVITLYLKDGESVAISRIPEGTAYTVKEDLSDATVDGTVYTYNGYTDQTGQVSGAIDADSTDTAAIVNKFQPTQTDSEIAFTIRKEVVESGTAQYDKDYTFQFKLEQYDPVSGSYTQIGNTVTLKDNESHSFAPLAPNALGNYYYKVSEVIPENDGDRYQHISYDATTARIVVFVTDNNADGVLEYVVKNYATDEVLNPDPNTGNYSISKVFSNTYTGNLIPSSVEFTVGKTVVDTSGVGVTGAGFLYLLTEVNEDGSALTGDRYEMRTQLVNGIGKATFHLPVTQAGSKFFKLTEFQPTIDPIPGMDYDKSVYYVTVSATVNEQDATMLDVSYTIATGNFASQGGTVISDSSNRNEVHFTNTLQITPATLALSVNKELIGREPNGNEFTFTLTETDGSFQNPTGYTDSIDLGKGTAAFNTLSFNKVGTHYYVITETQGLAGGMTYDPAVYHVTVTVTANGDHLVAAASVTKLGAGSVDLSAISFVNTYATKPVDFAITGNKVFTGNKALTKDLFTFELYDENGLVGSTTNNANGGFAFGTITYDKAGLYYYTVREVKGSLSGVTYDETEYTVIVTVTDDGQGNLSASASYGANNSTQPSLTFNNSYQAAAGHAYFGGNKTLSGRTGLALQDKEFTFALYSSNQDFSTLGSLITTTTNDGSGDYGFGLTYQQPGTHYYILKEDASAPIGGISYSTMEYHITVNVFDPGHGTLRTTVNASAAGVHGSVPADALDFLNLYTLKPVSANLQGTKVVRDKLTQQETIPAADAFTFELYEAVENVAAATFEKSGDVLQSKKNDGQGIFTFDPLNFTAAGTYYFMVVEYNDGQYDIDYDTTEYLVTVRVADNNYGELQVTSVKVAGTQDDTIRFVNIYDPTMNPKDGRVVIEVEKLLDMNGYTGVNVSKAGFKFQIQGVGNSHASVVTTDVNGKAAFVLDYNEDDIGNTYRYTITELTVDKGDITFSTEAYDVTVSIGVDGRDLTTEVMIDNTLTASPAVTFTNTYDPTLSDKETTIWVDVTKVIENDYAAVIGKDGFQFQMVNTADATDVITVTSDASGKATFSKKFTQLDIGKTFTYQITEIAVAGTDMDYSTAQYTLVVAVDIDANGRLVADMNLDGVPTDAPAVSFTNTYDPTNTPKETQVKVDVNKVIDNAYATVIGKDGFQFQMVNTADATDVITVTSDASGKAVFTKKFTEKDIGKTFTYEITEIDTKVADILYSSAKYTLVVTVDVDAAGKLVAAVTLDGNATNAPTVSFTNTYDPGNTAKETEVKVDVTKVVENTYNTVIGKDGFKFQMVNTADANDVTTVTSDASGKAVFTKKYTEKDIGKTFTYEITEITVAGTDFDYSTAQYTLAVTVDVDAAGKLVAAVKLDGVATAAPAVNFTNTYDPTNTSKETEVKVDVNKFVENAYNANIGKGGFKFQMVNTADASDVITVTSDASGKATFSKKYTEKDIGKTFTYEITEIAAAGSDIDFSTAKYTLVVTVGLDAAGKLATEVKLDGNATNAPAVSFTNTYDPTNTPKETQVKVDVTKVVENTYNTVIGKDGFKFQMVNTADATDVITVTSDASGKAAFSKKFTEKDIGKTFTYQISEIIVGGTDIDYSTAKYTLVVTVDIDADGALETAVKLDGTATAAPAVTFTNTYDPTNTPKETQVKVDVNKVVENDYAANVGKDGFKFQMVNTADATDVITVTSDASGKAVFTKKFTEKDIGKTFTYEITEIAVAGTDMDYSTAQYTLVVTVDIDANSRLVTDMNLDGVPTDAPAVSFTNTYDPTNTPKETQVKVDVTKVVENAYSTVIGKDGFKFQMVNTADATDVITVTSDASGKAVFTKKYTEKDIGKTFTYEITEIDTKVADILYSAAKYTLVVTVDVDVTGKLVTDVKLDGAATDAPAVSFTNTYDPTNTSKETEVKVDVTKVVENTYNTVIGKDGFKFQMVNTADANDVITVTSDASGKAVFTKKYTEKDIGKAFTYEITEIDTKVADILYSAAKYTLVVTVDVDATGKLVTAVKLDGVATAAPAVSFTNTYDPTLTDKELKLPVDITKVLDNKTPTVAPLNGFEFLLTDVVGKVSGTTQTDKDGKAAFTVTFTQEHIGKTFTYELTEIDTKIEGMTYDTTVHTFTVTVGLDAEGKLAAALTANGVAVDKLQASFTNIYDGPPAPSPTGDNAQLDLWVMLMLLSACAVVVLAAGKKKLFEI